jgi:hypothetical protein
MEKWGVFWYIVELRRKSAFTTDKYTSNTFWNLNTFYRAKWNILFRQKCAKFIQYFEYFRQMRKAIFVTLI